jgi:hypothetical protein
MPIDPSVPQDESRLRHQRLVERSTSGTENASPEERIRGPAACWCARAMVEPTDTSQTIRPADL